MAKTIEGETEGARRGESATIDVQKPPQPGTPQADARASGAGRDHGQGPGGGIVNQGRRAGMVHALGKRHRPPPPSSRGIKHSDQRISRMKAATMRGRRGGRG